MKRDAIVPARLKNCVIDRQHRALNPVASPNYSLVTNYGEEQQLDLPTAGQTEPQGSERQYLSQSGPAGRYSRDGNHTLGGVRFENHAHQCFKL